MSDDRFASLPEVAKRRLDVSDAVQDLAIEGDYKTLEELGPDLAKAVGYRKPPYNAMTGYLSTAMWPRTHYVPEEVVCELDDEGEEVNPDVEYVSDENSMFTCAACGYPMLDEWFDDRVDEKGFHHATPRFNFCPDCGSWVAGVIA